MNKTLMVSLVAGCVAVGPLRAADGGKALSPEEQQVRSALFQKYDSNQDGVLDKTETKRMSKKDKNALAKTGGVGTAKQDAKAKKGQGESKAQEVKKPDKTPKGDKAAEPRTDKSRKDQGTTKDAESTDQPVKGKAKSK